MQYCSLQHWTLLPSPVTSTALSNAVKLWAMPCRATQDRRVMVESSDKMWSTGEGNGKPLQYFCLENAIFAQYATGDQRRINSRKKEEMEPKQKQHPGVDVTGDGNKLQPFLCLGMFPPYPLWRIFIINRCWILSKAFSASIEMILWFLSNLWKCYITLIDLWVWNHTCFPGMNPV